MQVQTEKHAEASKWVNDYSDMLYAFAVQRTGNAHLSRDMVQETFLAAWKNYDSYKGEASVKNWLFAILKNKMADHYRKAATRFTDELNTSAGYDPFFDADDHWSREYYPKDWKADYMSTTETKEFYGVLDKCKSKLKEIQQAVFFMKYVDGLKSTEICKMLQLSESNYWVIMHRARVQLRACLEMNWFKP